MKALDFVAMRLGVAKPRGWVFQDKYAGRAIRGQTQSPQAGDIYFAFEQKGVDMRIGIDVATLSLKKIVERIILISGDTDMIPAMKLARREGVQVVLVEVSGCRSLAKALDEDADLIRSLTPVP